MARYELTDQQWERIAPLLPPTHTGKRGHPWSEHRPVLNAILWILRSGAPWADLPERYPPRSTCHDRLQCWQANGTWERVLQALQSEADQNNEVIWVNNAIDASSVRAHQHAAGARRQKKRPKSGQTEIYLSVVSTGNDRLRSQRSLRRGTRSASKPSAGPQSRRAHQQSPSAR